MLNTVVRTGQVLELFDREHPEWGVTEIARELDVPKTNAHEILSTLASINLLQRSGRSRYRLGWRLVGLATGVPLADRLRAHAPPVMRDLTLATSQTTHLAVWDGQQLMFLGRVLGRRGLDQTYGSTGSRLFAHCTASGKVLLADLPWAEVRQRISGPDLAARTSRSLRDEAALHEELGRVRDSGVGYNMGESDVGVGAMAVPIRDEDGRAVAALGITALLSDFPAFRERYEPMLKTMGQALGRRLAQGSPDVSVEWSTPESGPADAAFGPRP